MCFIFHSILSHLQDGQKMNSDFQTFCLRHFIDHVIKEEAILAENSGCLLLNIVLVLVEASKGVGYQLAKMALAPYFYM